LWSWVALLAAMSVPIVVLGRVLPGAFGGRPAPRSLPYALWGAPLLLAIWFSLGRLVTEVRESGLSIHFQLLWAERMIPWSEIRTVEAVTYSPRRRGVRWGARGTTYNVSGNRGVRIELADGGSVLVGSQRADELADAIAERIGVSEPRDREA
jgi:hypothetical protein